MIDALVYLEKQRLINGASQKLRRLRQPRYLFGALAAAGYFYFTFFRTVISGARAPTLTFLPAALLEAFAALLLLVPVIGVWIFPTGRASLRFSEAEIGFLFPAPISRRSLIHFKLIRGQISVLISALFLVIVSRRWAALGGPAWVHLLGWWLILSFLSLHAVGAAFTRDRLLSAGVTNLRRRLTALAAIVALIGVSIYWLHNAPGAVGLTSLDDLQAYLGALLKTPPLSWALAPLRLVVRPFLARDGIGFALAALPVFGLLALEYFWVLRSEVAFEEASLIRATQRSERMAAARGERVSGGTSKVKLRPEPFRLKPMGFRPLAILWANLIELGKFFYPRSCLTISAVILGTTLWLAHHPQYHPLLQVLTFVSAIVPLYAMLFAPALARRSAQRMLERFDTMKGYPLRGWQVVLGQLLTPILLLSWVDWTFLSVFMIGATHGTLPSQIAADPAFAGAAALALCIPALGGILFTLNIAGVLYFPAWAGSGQNGPGIERMGQRLIFLSGYLLVLLAALLPAILVGGAIGLFAYWITDNLITASAFSAPIVALVLFGELGLFIVWLGKRYENFDLSAEISR